VSGCNKGREGARIGVTLEAIVRELKLSRTTVSRALNDSGLVNEETKQRVLELARKLHYKPNALARGLATRRSGLIAVIASALGNAFYTKIMHSIERVLSETDYEPIFFDSRGNPKNEERHLDTIIRLRVDGVIITTTWPTVDVFSEVLRAKIPMVFVDNIIETVPSHSVTVDNYMGVKEVVEYLIENNHRRICYFAGNERVYVYRKRLEGYMAAMHEAQLSPLVCKSGTSMEEGYQTAQKVLKSESRPTAIVCVSDNAALGALHAIREQQMAVPEDISLVGFNNLDFSKYIEPPLTTVSQPAEAMGKTAAELMVACIEGGNDLSRRENIIFSPKIVVRESTRRI